MIDDDIPISHADLSRSLRAARSRKHVRLPMQSHVYGDGRNSSANEHLPLNPSLDLAGENSRACDCEVIFNTAPEWEEITGMCHRTTPSRIPDQHATHSRA